MNEHEEMIWRTARGFQESRILLTGVELGVFTALADGPLDSETVARTIQADARGTDRLLQALTALGWLNKDESGFSNSSAADKHLVNGRKGDMTGALMHTNGLYHRWGRLTASVRRGTATDLQPDTLEDRTEAFIAAMHHNAGQRAEEVVSRINLEGVRRVLDVGGGSGAYAMAFCRTNPDIEAVVFDLPEVTPITRRYVEQAGLTDRVTTVDGNYHESSLGDNFDLVLLSAVVHSNSAAENTTLLKRCAAALSPAGRIVIQDFVMDEQRHTPARGALFALNMLVNTEAGDTFTEREIADWLQEAGCEMPERVDIPTAGTTLLISHCAQVKDGKGA